MIRTATILSAIALVLLVSVATRADAAPRCGRAASMPEAKALAEQAAAHLRDAGVGKAFRDFIDPDSPYLTEDLYVFVFRRDGLMMLNAGFPQVMGSNVLAGPGGGAPFAQDAMRITKDGGAGWITYNWYNPCTGQMMAKQSYVIGVGNMVLGVGAYGNMLST